MSTSELRSYASKRLSATTKCHLLLSVAGGVLITALLIAASVAANRTGNERLGGALFVVVFWTWGIFGSIFDSILGTESYWMPNPVGLVMCLLFNVLLYSVLSYVLLWVIREFRYAGRVDL